MAVTEIMSVRRTVIPSTSPRTSRKKDVAMTIKPEIGGTVLNIPYAPQEVNHTNLTAEYTSTPRPGLLDNINYTNLQRPRMTLTLEMHDKKVTTTSGGVTTQQRAISVIKAIQNMARKGTRVRIAYGTLESGLWYILSMSVKSRIRDPLTDEIIGATVDMECVRGDASIAGKGTGPTSGGATNPSGPQASVPVFKAYVVKAGDNLFTISLKYYGTTIYWNTIGDANKILDPKKLKVGQVLRIP